MSVLSSLMSADHRRCDDFFAAAERAVEQADWGAAKTACATFCTAMARHMDAEELHLFPAFEAAIGSSQGPTQMMRHEHQQIRGLMDDLAQTLGARDAEGYRGVAETLLIMMQQHNLKEENILYPMCDAQLQADAAPLAEVLHKALSVAP